MAFKQLQRHSIDGPIPGENYTSDTKNYPWHRPPEFTEPDEAISYISNIMMDEKGAVSILSMLQLGITVLQVTEMIILKGMGAGKWTLDLGLLIAGPISHIIILMAKAYEVEYEVGFSDIPPMPGKHFFNELKKIEAKKAKEAVSEIKDDVEGIKQAASGGFLDGLAEEASEDAREVDLSEDGPEESDEVDAESDEEMEIG